MVISKAKIYLFILCAVFLISGCGEDSSGSDSYRLIDALGSTIEHVDPPENLTTNKKTGIKYDRSGGAASLASILNFLYGYSFSETDVNEELLFYGDYGDNQPQKFTFYDMKLFVEAIGQRANGYTYEDLCSYQAFTTDELSTVLGAALLPIEIDGYRHFVVLQGYDENYVYFLSPLEGKICFNYRVFCAVNYIEEVFVVWPDGINPLAKGKSLQTGNFKKVL